MRMNTDIASVGTLIGDPRESNGICIEQDDVKILHDARKISGKARTILHTVIAHHTNDNCVEICCVHVRLNIESPRIYVNYKKLKNAIDPELYNSRMSALKEEIKQQRREYKPQKAALQVSNELVLEYLMRRLHLSEECSEVHGVFMMDLRIVAGDATKVIPHPDDFEVKLTVSDILCEKPRALLPVKLDSTAKPSKPPLRDPAMQVHDFHLLDEKRQNERRKSEFNRLRDLSVEDLRKSLNNQYQALHSQAWVRWKKATGKIMVRIVQVPKMKERIKHSCVAEWYEGALRIRSKNIEREKRRRLQHESINAIANAEIPAKVDRMRLCYTKHSDEIEKQKAESVAKLGNGMTTPSGKEDGIRSTMTGSRKVQSEDLSKKKRRPSLTSSDNVEKKKSTAVSNNTGAKRRPSLTSLNSTDTGYSGSGGGYTLKSIIGSGHERRHSNRSAGSAAGGLESDSDDDCMMFRMRSVRHSNQTTPRVEGRKLPPLDPSLSPRLSPVHSPRMLPLNSHAADESKSINEEPLTAMSTGRRPSIENDLLKTAQQLQRRSRHGSIKPSIKDNKLPSVSPSGGIRKGSISAGSSEAKRRHSYDGRQGSFENQLKSFQEHCDQQERQYTEAQLAYKNGQRLKQRRSFVLMNEYEKIKESEHTSTSSGAADVPPSLISTFGTHAQKVSAHVPLEAFTDPFAKKLNRSANSETMTTTGGETYPRKQRHRNQTHYSHDRSVGSRSSTIGSVEMNVDMSNDELNTDEISMLEQKLPNHGPLYSPTPGEVNDEK